MKVENETIDLVNMRNRNIWFPVFISLFTLTKSFLSYVCRVQIKYISMSELWDFCDMTQGKWAQGIHSNPELVLRLTCVSQKKIASKGKN